MKTLLAKLAAQNGCLSRLVLKFRIRRKLRLARQYVEYSATCNESYQHKNMALIIGQNYLSEARQLLSQNTK